MAIQLPPNSTGTVLDTVTVATKDREIVVLGDGVAATTATVGANGLKVDPSGVTSPVSGTVTANIGTSGSLALDASVANLSLTQGAATAGQKAILAEGAVTTAAPAYTTGNSNPLSLNASGGLRVDGSGVTQPVSGTVTANQGTAGAVSGAWPAKVTDGTNVAAVKAASTAAVAADPAAVAQISPNQPQLTTPLNVQGAKTNNAAAPGATNLGVLSSLANAAVPSLTEGNLAALSVDLAGNLRVYTHPANSLGVFAVSGRTAVYTGLAASAPLVQLRNGTAGVLIIVLKYKVMVTTTVAATTAGFTQRELIIGRSWTVSDTGTAITLTGNNNKRRTSQATSIADLKHGAPLTAGTRTLDANAVAQVLGFEGLNHLGALIGSTGQIGATAATAVGATYGPGAHPVLLYDINRDDYPIVLAQNEGLLLRFGPDAQPAGATNQTYFEVVWAEAAAF